MSVQDMLPGLVSLPPHTAALGFELESVDGDVVTLKVPYREDLVGDPDTGVLAGGVVSALLDHACGCAVWVKQDRFAPIATLDLRIDYMRGSRPGKPVYARARCFKLGRSVAFVRAWAFDETEDDPVAAAQAAFMLDSDGERKAGANLKGRGR